MDVTDNTPTDREQVPPGPEAAGELLSHPQQIQKLTEMLEIAELRARIGEAYAQVFHYEYMKQESLYKTAQLRSVGPEELEPVAQQDPYRQAADADKSSENVRPLRRSR